MSSIIKILPEYIVNQIAAGEVIQRPASVIKELLENSIDAQSSIIKIHIKEAGKKLIQIIDNGVGMDETDAALCLKNHATSKLNSAKDLFSIKTMGFRGEALCSIASTAQIELKTSQNSNNIGIKILVEQNKIQSTTPITMQKGTSIAVKNIFCNVPARRAFLKSNNIEYKCILEEFFRIAIANFHVAFSFYNDNELIYNLPSSKLNQRILNIFGNNYKKQMLPCHENISSIKITGYIGKPEHAKKSITDKFIYVNNRFIKSNLLYGIIKNSYENLVKTEHVPFFAIFIDIDPKLIDVNVHPNKIEIKFEDDKLVHSIIKSAIKKALACYHVSPAINFSKQIDLIDSMDLYNHISYDEQQHKESESFTTSQKKNIMEKTWEELKANASERQTEKQIIFNSSINDTVTNNKYKSQNELQYILFRHKYLLIKLNNALKLINLIAAQHRIIFDRYIENTKRPYSQKLLLPITMDIPNSRITIIKENLHFFTKIGFIFELLDNKLLIHNIPTDMQNIDISFALDNILYDLENDTYSFLENKQSSFALSSAKNSIKENFNIRSQQEIDSIIEQLFTSKNPTYTPDGGKILVTLSLEEIEDMFKC